MFKTIITTLLFLFATVTVQEANCKTNDESMSIATLHSTSGDTVIVKDSKGYLYQIMSENKAGVAPGGAYSGDIVIPSQIKYEGNTYTVTTVRRGAMWKKQEALNIGNITSITLPETVTLVGADAFRGNKNLTSVNYGNKTRIEVRSFWGCPKLQLQQTEPSYAFTEPYNWSKYKGKSAYPFFTKMYCPNEKKDVTAEKYNWAFFKYNHCGITFDSWKNLDNEEAIECYCTNMKYLKAGLFRMQNPDNVESMFKGYTDGDVTVMLTDNNYVATHEFLMFSRWIWGEEEIDAPKGFKQMMESQYKRKVKYSKECAKLLYTTNERLIITEFEITNHEAMIVLSWLKDGKTVCSFEEKQKTDPEYEEYGVWNVDDDGTYGIPNVMTIARDENGNIELFALHSAPESLNFSHYKQKGNKLVEVGKEQWYVWVDCPYEEEQ